jgi:hypothetical protein
MKIIFLDIDGVLVITSDFKDRVGKCMVADENCIKQLNAITDATKAKIVISSSWKYCGQQEISLIMKYWGVTGKVIGVTPELSPHWEDGKEFHQVDRGLEIQKFLDDKVGVKSFVIIDDFGIDHLKQFLVKTQFQSGLTEELANKAIEILKGNK